MENECWKRIRDNGKNREKTERDGKEEEEEEEEEE